MDAASNMSEGQLQPARSDYTEIVVIRHGETEWNASRMIQRSQRHPDVVLNVNGGQQVAAVAERLSKEPKISAVYCSDLRRAIDTAQIIATTCGVLEVIRDPALQEKPSGDQKIMSREESINELNQRAASCLQRIGNKHRGERVVVVTHGSVMRALHKRVFPNEHAEKVWTTSMSVLHLSDGDEWSIKMWGDVSHLNKTASV